MGRRIIMKFYSEIFLKSELFYTKFYLPSISLTEYIVREAYFRELNDFEAATKIVNQEYFLHCENYFINSILFYDELSKYILNKDGSFQLLNQYIFFKLCYYGTKFLDISNESINFFEEERKKFKENKYDKAILELSQFRYHDADAAFQYKNNILQITYRFGNIEETLEFYGVENWVTKEFMTKEPTLKIEELYEEIQGTFVYNTMWNHLDVLGENYSELSIKFSKLIRVK